MINVVSAEELKSLSESEEVIANYCNFNNFEISDNEFNESFNSFLVSLCAIIKSKRNNIEYYVANISDIKGKKYIKVKYKVGRTEQRMTFYIKRIGYDKFINSLSEFITISVLGSEAVEYLNNRIENVQSNGNSSLSFIYMVSTLDFSSDIYDWDYDKIKIRLNKKSSINLINKYLSNELDQCIDSTDWSMKICEYIAKFDTLAFHESINATLNSDNIGEILSKNMVSSNDITLVASKMKSNNVNSVKTVSLINELGKFIVICNWKFEDNKVYLEVMHSKVLDVENNRFVSNRDIVDRLKEKILKQYSYTVV